MPDQPSQPPKESAADPSLLSLGSVKCDLERLFKVRADGTRVLEFPLREILELRYESRFKLGRLLAGLAWGVSGLACYLAIDNPWIKWPLASLGLLIAVGTLIELRDKLLHVRTKAGESVVDLDDGESDYDSRAFVQSVQIRLNGPR
jgi:hypothetical protein